ncbi:MAG: caspase family protein [Cyanobacteria bacterium P01_H01_bin.105]
MASDMNYRLGLTKLESFIDSQDEDLWRDFQLYKGQLLGNLREEERFGRTETLHNERFRFVDKLNPLALAKTGISFVDLCLGVIPSKESQGVSDNYQRVNFKGDKEYSHTEALFGTGKSWAILIGVNEYQDKNNYGNLQVCIKDVIAIKKQLIKSGYDQRYIQLLTDDAGETPSRNNIVTTTKAIADATEPDDLLLFYYSGHGDEMGGESYLLACDGQYPALEDTAISISRIKSILEEASARAKVLIVDACHSGADIGGKGAKKMSAEFLRNVFEQAEGFAILSSCKQGQVSYEWRAQNRSAFTHFLLEALAGKADLDNKGFVSVQDVNRFVVDEVKLWAAQNKLSQTPTLEYTVAGDIILARYVS